MIRDAFATFLQGFSYSIFDTAAARHFHTYDSHTPDIIIGKDFSQFHRVIYAVKLSKSDNRYAIADEIIMEVPICISCAVSCYKKI